MSLRRSQKKKRPIKSVNPRQTNRRKSAPSVPENRLSNHYVTRSKSARTIASETSSKETVALSRRSSDNSVICLGSFRKVPELIILEDSNDCYEAQTIKQSDLKTSRSEELKDAKIENLVH